MSRYALLIGTDTYDDPSFTDLLVPGKDIEALHSVLTTKEIAAFPSTNTQVLLNHSQAEVRKAIGAFFKGKKKDDLLLFYFSGHGELDEDGDLYLAFGGTEKANLMGTALEASMVESAFRKCNATRQIIILDCCYSGVMSAGGKSAVDAKELDRWKGHGREILTSSSATQKSWESQSLGLQSENSLFTHYLIEGLQTGKPADSELITVEQLFNYASTKVKQQTGRMTPERRVENQRENIVIARNPNPPLKLPKDLLAGLTDNSYLARERAVQVLDEQYIKPNNPKIAPKVLKLLQDRLRGENMEPDFRVRSAIEAVLTASKQTQQSTSVPPPAPAVVKAPVLESTIAEAPVAKPERMTSSVATDQILTEERRPERGYLIPWVISPFIGMLPIEMGIGDASIYLYYFVIPVAAWMGYQYRRSGLLALAFALFPMLLYSGYFGPLSYGGNSGEYLVALVVCWACAYPDKWWSRLKSSNLSAISLFLLLVTFELTIGIKGDFGSIGWTSYSSPFLLLVFALGISGKKGRTIVAVSLGAALLGFILSQSDAGSFVQDQGNGMSAYGKYGFDSIRDLLRVFFIFALGRVIGITQRKFEAPQWLFSWRGYAAFVALWMFSAHFISLRPEGIQRLNLTGSEDVIWVLAFTAGVVWKSKAVVPISIAVVLTYLESLMMLLLGDYDFTWEISQVSSISIYVPELAYLTNVIIPAILFYQFGKYVASYLESSEGKLHFDQMTISKNN